MIKNLLLAITLAATALGAGAQNRPYNSPSKNVQATQITGTVPVANGGTGVTTSTGSGSVVLSASPTLTGTANAAALTLSGAQTYGASVGNLNADGAIVTKYVTGDHQYYTGVATGMRVVNQAANTVLMTISNTGVITFPQVTTGTNADFLCMSSGNMLTLQTSACTISSRRFKENIAPLTGSALRKIGALRPVVFNMIELEHPNADNNYGRTQVGLLAENVAAVDPKLAIYEQDGTTPKSYRQEALLALAIKAIQEQQLEINALKRSLVGAVRQVSVTR